MHCKGQSFLTWVIKPVMSNTVKYFEKCCYLVTVFLNVGLKLNTVNLCKNAKEEKFCKVFNFIH